MLDQRRELAHDALVDRPFERHNEAGQLLEPSPAPGVELGLVAGLGADVDLAILAGEAHREPVLALAAVAPLERDADELGGQVVGEPARDLADDLRAGDARLLRKLPPGRGDGRLAPRNTTLRHLPDVACRRRSPFRQPAPDPDETRAVDQHDPDARPIRQLA